MKRNTSELIAVIGLLLVLEACDSSSNKAGTKAADPVNANAAGTGTTASNAGGATAINSATSASTANVASNTDEETTVKTDNTADASVTIGKDGGGTGGKATNPAKGKDAAVAPAKDATVAAEQMSAEEQKMLEMYQDKKTHSAAEVDPLYEKLEAVPSEFLIGTWKGGVFEENPSNPQNWYGKKIYPDLTADAWLTNNPDGSPGPNNPIMGGMGPATIRQEEYKGKTSAVLVYANQVVRDYFRKIRGDYSNPELGDIVIGFSTYENNYFHLTRTFK